MRLKYTYCKTYFTSIYLVRGIYIHIEYIAQGGIDVTSRFNEFCNKEIINVTNGIKVGYVDDIIFDTSKATVCSLVVYGRLRFFGLLGRGEDMIINWEDIEVIGEDTILIKNDGSFENRKPSKPGAFEKLFG